jgi:hypothetical protein
MLVTFTEAVNRMHPRLGNGPLITASWTWWSLPPTAAGADDDAKHIVYVTAAESAAADATSFAERLPLLARDVKVCYWRRDIKALHTAPYIYTTQWHGHLY